MMLVPLAWSVVVLAAGPAPAAKKPAATARPAVSAPAATPTPTPTPPPTPTPVPTPSISESIEFVKEKLATYGSHDFEVGSSDDPNEAGRITGLTSVRGFDTETCVLTLGRTLDIMTSTAGDPEADFHDASSIELRIPLKEVNVSVGFADDEIATRAKKALENAIGLCQRKKEAF